MAVRVGARGHAHPLSRRATAFLSNSIDRDRSSLPKEPSQACWIANTRLIGLPRLEKEPQLAEQQIDGRGFAAWRVVTRRRGLLCDDFGLRLESPVRR